ncbi:MAG: hypothetical protein AABX70_00735 [Nanoarchaeota archaeon]
MTTATLEGDVDTIVAEDALESIERNWLEEAGLTEQGALHLCSTDVIIGKEDGTAYMGPGTIFLIPAEDGRVDQGARYGVIGHDTEKVYWVHEPSKGPVNEVSSQLVLDSLGPYLR